MLIKIKIQCLGSRKLRENFGAKQLRMSKVFYVKNSSFCNKFCIPNFDFLNRFSSFSFET